MLVGSKTGADSLTVGAFVGEIQYWERGQFPVISFFRREH